MSEPDEDFAAMFEASLQAKRFERGQTIEGTIVAIGPEVAFVNVGGKGEAMIEIAELKDDDGALEVAVGDRIQAMVVSTEGGLTLSRRLARGAATAAAARRRVPRRSAGGRQGRTGGEGRIRGAHRPPARLLPVLPDRHRPEHGSGGARRARLRIPDHRVQGRRQEPRRLAACAARGGAAGQRRRDPAIDRRRRGDDRARHVRARVRRLRRPGRRRAGSAPRVRDGVVPRVGRVAGRHARRGDHRQGPARRRRHAEDRPRVEAAHRRSVVDGAGHLRGGPGAHRPRHAPRGVRGVRRAGAGGRRAGARLHVRADRAIGGVVPIGRRGR